MGIYANFRDGLQAFSPQERRNIIIYIAGIMVYKFGLEAFNGSVVALATNRYDFESIRDRTPSRTFERVGLLTGLNQAFQCVGSILIAPLVKRFATKNVLSCAILVFGLCTTLLLIIDAATGGTFMPAAYAMIPVYCVSGIAYGMVELIRRVIPRDIVGGNVQKLKRLDSIVHIFYEITGTAGAFTTGLVIIPRLGNNMAFIITPVCFAVSAAIWFFISELDFQRKSTATTARELRKKPMYWKAAFNGLYLFGESIWVGCRILFSSRKFVWLVPGYAVALYAHRYLENGIAPQVARRYLGESAWAQIMVGGSNLGELLGALCVLLFTSVIQTPMPWLRLDALMLLIVWYIPYWRPPVGQVGQAWIVAATFAPISFGWAAGDVSLAAYIQASLTRLESKNKNVSALGAVMAFLYSFYIVTYAIAGTLLGRYLDGVYNKTGGSDGGSISGGLVYTAGLQFTLICVLVFASTFVPKGSLAFNPSMISEEKLGGLDPMEDKAPTTPDPISKNRQRKEYRNSDDESAVNVPKSVCELV
ncbi:major facilitator superfamily domain-containing protein [Lasiosphaeris hirsuta]|uniref:Major facilitator superfamily domain-containing protein n=1 Tax=Lasiosphaeris hirsuta TaxID=260670 RepID=A0AA40B1B0_9PEZI|nr:major facilitator superfamily domain-containing protein [Lasiosphaeris hirsuta]